MMKNVYKLNEFLRIRKAEKLNEADRFANDITFSESLIGRLFNNIFSFFRKNIYSGLLMIYKRKLEDAYFEGVLKALAKANVNANEIKKEEPVYNAESASADDIVDSVDDEVKVNNDTNVQVQDKPVEVTEDEAIKIYMEYTNKTHDELARNHKIIKDFIEGVGDNPYNPETANIKDYTKLKKGMDYLWEELKEIEEFFKKDAYDSGFNKIKTYMDVPANREAILSQMKRDITEKYANFRKETNADLRDAMRGAMESTIGDWEYISDLIVKGVQRIKDTKDKTLEVTYNNLKKTIEKKLTTPTTTRKQTVEPKTVVATTEAKIYEADDTETDSEKAAKKDETMEERYPDAKDELKDIGQLKAGDLNGAEIRKKFEENPGLKDGATDAVNKEKIKDVQLSAELLYHRDEKAENTENRGLLTKNFRAGDKEKYALETKWKKMIAKVKKNYVGLLDVDALDPIVLVNQDTNLRDKALKGEIIPSVSKFGTGQAYVHLLEEKKDKFEIIFDFPDEDFKWCLLRNDTHGFLAYKFNLPTPGTSNYEGQHLSFFIHSIYNLDKIDFTDANIEPNEAITNALVLETKLDGVPVKGLIKGTNKISLLIIENAIKGGKRPASKGTMRHKYLLGTYDLSSNAEPYGFKKVSINLNMWKFKNTSSSYTLWSNKQETITSGSVAEKYGEYKIWSVGTNHVKFADENNEPGIISKLIKTKFVQGLRVIRH